MDQKFSDHASSNNRIKLKELEYFQYKTLDQDVAILDNNTMGKEVDPYALQNIWIHLPLEVVAGNFFDMEAGRTFFFLDKKLKYYIDEKSTCMKMRSYAILCAVPIGSMIFLLYAICKPSQKWLEESDEDEEPKPSAIRKERPSKGD